MRLRREHARQRDRGHSFTVAWPIAQSRGLAGLGRSEAIFWRRTWNAEQRTAWALSYSRAPWPAKRGTLFTLDREHARGDLVVV